ncbi:small multidrug efflux protein [Agrococcus jejuensis]|uniref:Small multidrug efflux protein n=1 Tax=Agrococcus jejuensis TaxID=399736 RepID=A0A1G8FKJ0_9MICO|nr:small multidrug efflux protein [Agrococcus jejuensis]SDH82559.1 hypothetical protein SAMN04489720_2513 [Agrococcus jejuensis]
MSSPLDDLVAGFQHLAAQVPEWLQPLVISLAGAVPFVEGEGSAAIGVVAGLHPVVAGVAGVIGNLVAVTIVVLLGSRIREAAVARRRRTAAVRERELVGAGGVAVAPEPAKPESKGRRRVKQWLTRFGVPGASLLAPIALPTHFTAATLVASGVPKGWVLLWQAIAIVLWTTLVVVIASGVLAAVAS